MCPPFLIIHTSVRHFFNVQLFFSGRRITKDGQRDLDRIACQVAARKQKTQAWDLLTNKFRVPPQQPVAYIHSQSGSTRSVSGRDVAFGESRLTLSLAPKIMRNSVLTVFWRRCFARANVSTSSAAYKFGRPRPFDQSQLPQEGRIYTDLYFAQVCNDAAGKDVCQYDRMAGTFV